MRHKILKIIIFGLIIAFFAMPSFADDGNTYFQMPFKKLLEEPHLDANLVYEIPIDVKLLGVTKNRNWYKVSIEFDLLFLGHYKYSGWVFAPIEDQIRLAEDKVIKEALKK